MTSHADIIRFVRDVFQSEEFIPLHEPRFWGNEKAYLNECIDSTFVSSVGKFVNLFEEKLAAYTGAKYAVATVNGTAALHIALLLAGVEEGDEVLSQALTFVATANAISYCSAHPVFVDVEMDSLGMCPEALRRFLETHTTMKEGNCINQVSGRRIRACVPMHTFGHPCRVDEIKEVCDDFGILVVEDAAESMGSFYKGRHTGLIGACSAISFNGNKVITAGGGGAIITNDESLAKAAKHITTTAKKPHRWEYVHDQVGFNYRMPNLNAALLVAQLEQLDGFLQSKRELAGLYRDFFRRYEGIEFFDEPSRCQSNFWFQTVLFPSISERNQFLEESNQQGVMTRPVWKLMNELAMFKDAQHDGLKNSLYLQDRIVNLPSSARRSS